MSKLYCPNCGANLTNSDQGGILRLEVALKELPPIAVKIPYVSIDIETTGLDENSCQILEFGAVYDDWTRPLKELPRFRRIIKWDEVIGSPFAMALNADLLKQIASAPKTAPNFNIWDDAIFCEEDHLLPQFANWLKSLGIDPLHVQPAGKNFANFDLQFIKKLPQYGNLVDFNHRTLDPAILFWNPLEDEKLLDTKTCMERAGIEGKVAHTAIDDALVIVELVRFGARRLCQLKE